MYNITVYSTVYDYEQHSQLGHNFHRMPPVLHGRVHNGTDHTIFTIYVPHSGSAQCSVLTSELSTEFSVLMLARTRRKTLKMSPRPIACSVWLLFF